MTTRKVILSHPYSGSFHAFFDSQVRGRLATDHPYYRTLYGKRFDSYTAMALTLTILYPEIILAPADATVFVQGRGSIDEDGYFLDKALGISADFDEFRLVLPAIKKDVQEDLSDHAVSRILASVPMKYRKNILQDARMEMLLARKHRCPIVCADGRRALIQRLTEIDAEQRKVDVIESGSLRFVEEYLSVAGLTFQPASIDLLYDLKTDDELRTYAKSFSSVMHDFRSERDARMRLLTLAKGAIHKGTIAKHVTGFFKVVSTVFSCIGLLPHAGGLAQPAELNESNQILSD